MAIQQTHAARSAATNGKHGHSLISDEKFRQLYTMALDFLLAAEDGMAAPAGREAALAGVSADLHRDDVLVTQDGWRLTEGSEMGMPGVPEARVQSISGMGERVVDALSAAMADRVRRNGRVTVLLFPEEQDGRLLAEAQVLAAGAKLPVIFVEQAGEHDPPSQGSKAHRKFRTDGLISIPVDAHDVVAIYRVAHESIARAREGNGPTRIVCLSLPVAGERGLRTHRNNAVANLERWLVARGLPVEEWRQEIVARRAGENSRERQESRERVPENAA